MKQDIRDFNSKLENGDREICNLLADTIDRHLPQADAKIWHRHPVWFLAGNPTVGYSKQKRGIRLMFWSGAGFDEPGLDVLGAKFKDASTFYRSVKDVDASEIVRWLDKSREIAWDYKHIVKRKGILERLK
ncbi:MAG: DUF1801 domain-containing protein [Tabrizicola sp.]|nr:DUF1801 domain-containing protein [Tabrizicola sp.]